MFLNIARRPQHPEMALSLHDPVVISLAVTHGGSNLLAAPVQKRLIDRGGTGQDRGKTNRHVTPPHFREANRIGTAVVLCHVSF